MKRRRSGLLVPLFSSPSSKSWGTGDINDLGPLTAWLSGAGQRVLQLLPLNEMAAGQQSPYTAISAMAIDPIFIHVPGVEDWIAAGGVDSLSVEDREALEWVRTSPRLEYSMIRRLKETALATAFCRFYEHEWSRSSARADALKAFLAAEGWWIDDYALFRAIRLREHGRSWSEWPEPLRYRDGEALEQVRRRFGREILFYQYLQWLAASQWAQARATAHAYGVEIFGDLPFMVDADSADVWANQHFFRLDVSVGAPPDAFSETGQDWGMPLYNWPVLAEHDFRWLRDRARRNSCLYDGYRVDHLVGFYRTYGRPRAGGEAFFSPAEQPEQTALGVRVLTLFKESGAEIIAEDLGTVPDFVRGSLADLGVPGFRILRWERRWGEEGQPFLDPADYPSNSVAASGTHDTEPMKVWWESATVHEREQLSRLPAVQRVTRGEGVLDRPYQPFVSDALLEVLFASASDLLLLPVQDVFAWSERINEPATVTPDNWTFRLPWPCDRLAEVPEAQRVQSQLREWSERYR